MLGSPMFRVPIMPYRQFYQAVKRKSASQATNAGAVIIVIRGLVSRTPSLKQCFNWSVKHILRKPHAVPLDGVRAIYRIEVCSA